MKKILFLIHDLGHGGAEKVLVNLVNNMDTSQFDITVMALFGGGVNEQFLAPHIRYRSVFKRAFPGNSHVMKLFSPGFLHKRLIKEHYDVEISFLEGPAARIIGGCKDPSTKTACWIHCTMQSEKGLAIGFRSVAEAKRCFSRFDRGIFVSNSVLNAFRKFCPMQHMQVLYNTNDSEKILASSLEPVTEEVFMEKEFRIIGVGKIEEVKGFDRLTRIHARLRRDGYPVHTYILGQGSLEVPLRQFLEQEGLTDSFTFLGYQTNPYKYVKNCDLFVCSSHSEGFSTAATEALIVGTPVCTVEVSGMKEMLGENNEWGIVTDNDEDALYQGIAELIRDPQRFQLYRSQAKIRGRFFSKASTVNAVQLLLKDMMGCSHEA